MTARYVLIFKMVIGGMITPFAASSLIAGIYFMKNPNDLKKDVKGQDKQKLQVQFNLSLLLIIGGGITLVWVVFTFIHACYMWNTEKKEIGSELHPNSMRITTLTEQEKQTKTASHLYSFLKLGLIVTETLWFLWLVTITILFWGPRHFQPYWFLAYHQCHLLCDPLMYLFIKILLLIVYTLCGILILLRISHNILLYFNLYECNLRTVAIAWKNVAGEIGDRQKELNAARVKLLSKPEDEEKLKKFVGERFEQEDYYRKDFFIDWIYRDRSLIDNEGPFYRDDLLIEAEYIGKVKKPGGNSGK